MTRLSAKEARRLGIEDKSTKGKYKSIKVEVDGITFDSRKEANRYAELRLMEKAGEITNLELQPEFLLQEGFRDKARAWHRAIKYKADFRYQEKGGGVVVEDVKGMRTEVYKIKKKLLLATHDIEFREI